MITAVRSFKMLAAALSAVMSAAVILTLGFTGCGGDNGTGPDPDPNGGGGGSGGTFTLTGIPSEHNGKYAVLVAQGRKMDEVYGAQSINVSTSTFTLVQISNGSVQIPMWIVPDGTPVRYSGNDNADEDETVVAIFNKATVTDQELSPNSSSFIIGVAFRPVQFANGSATKSWNDGQVFGGDNGGGEDVWTNVTSFSQVNGSWKAPTTATGNVQGMSVTMNSTNLIITFNAATRTVSQTGTETSTYSGGDIETLWPNVRAAAEYVGQQSCITATINDANHSYTLVSDCSRTLTDQQLAQQGYQINQHGTKLKMTQNGNEFIYTKQ